MRERRTGGHPSVRAGASTPVRVAHPLMVSASKISLTNAVGAEPHEIIVMRIEDSDTRSIEELQAKNAEPPTLEPQQALGIISLPGQTNSSVLVCDGTLEPGPIHLLLPHQPGRDSRGCPELVKNGGEPPPGWVAVE